MKYDWQIERLEKRVDDSEWWAERIQKQVDELEAIVTELAKFVKDTLEEE